MQEGCDLGEEGVVGSEEAQHFDSGGEELCGCVPEEVVFHVGEVGVGTSWGVLLLLWVGVGLVALVDADEAVLGEQVDVRLQHPLAQKLLDLPSSHRYLHPAQHVVYTFQNQR